MTSSAMTLFYFSLYVSRWLQADRDFPMVEEGHEAYRAVSYLECQVTLRVPRREIKCGASNDLWKTSHINERTNLCECVRALSLSLSRFEVPRDKNNPDRERKFTAARKRYASDRFIEEGKTALTLQRIYTFHVSSLIFPCASNRSPSRLVFCTNNLSRIGPIIGTTTVYHQSRDKSDRARTGNARYLA